MGSFPAKNVSAHEAQPVTVHSADVPVPSQPAGRPGFSGSSYLRWGWVSPPPMRSMRSR